MEHLKNFLIKSCNILLFLTCFYAQSQTIEQAKEYNSKLLENLKIIELDEVKEEVYQGVFSTVTGLPIISEYNILYEGLFNTSNDSVKGFKSLIEINTTSKAGIQLKKKIYQYMLLR